MKGLLIGLAIAAGCKGDSTISTGTGTAGATGTEACASDSTCPDGSICEDGECIAGDRNNSLEEAETLLWDTSTEGFINPDGDIDYFIFSASGGEFVRISTYHEFDDGDTVLTLRDAAGKVVAASDNYPTGGSVSNYDSVLYAYLVEGGDYSIVVEDIGTYYSGGDAEGDPDYSYALTLEEWGAHTIPTDSVEYPSWTYAPESAGSYSAGGALIESADTVHYVQVSMTLSDIDLYIYGMADLGNSEAQPRVRLLDTAGQVYLDRSGLGPDGWARYPGLPLGEYLMELSDATGAGGDNHWFFTFFNPSESSGVYTIEQEGNDALEEAQALEMVEQSSDDGSLYMVESVQGSAHSSEDDDWFAITAPYSEGGNWIGICLNSALYGSLYAPTVEVYDATGELLGSAEGSMIGNPNTYLDGLDVSSPGTYYARVVGPTEKGTGGVGYWWQATFYVASWDASGYGCP